MIVCTHQCEATGPRGMRLLLESLHAQEPGLPVVVYACAEFRQGLESLPEGLFPEFRPPVGTGVRPTRRRASTLLSLLEEGHREVVWLDSDVILTHPIRPLLQKADEEAIVAAEAFSGRPSEDGYEKALELGLKSKRHFDRGFSACILRVTPSHRLLLKAWATFPEPEPSDDTKGGPECQVSSQLDDDQHLLEALLMYEGFAGVPVHLLRVGEEVAHCDHADAYGTRSRLAHVGYRLPALVHAKGVTPWADPQHRPVYLDVSPYLYAAAPYVSHTADSDRWARPAGFAGRLLHALTLGEPNLAGLLPAAWAELRRRLRGQYQLQIL